jgi:type II secretory ATPase GspE/PulE/Tfp pilus assembly ATPase PilB-like protein
MLRSPERRKVLLARGIGCTICRGTGYYDRVGIFQFLEITDNMRELISRRPNPNQLYSLVRREKMRTLEESAVNLALTHQTSLEEIVYLMEYNN